MINWWAHGSPFNDGSTLRGIPDAIEKTEGNLGVKADEAYIHRGMDFPRFAYLGSYSTLHNNKEIMTDVARIASMASTLFAHTEGDSPESIEQRARFYKLVPGIHWPDDWDSLDQAEQKKRLDGMDKLGLKSR